MLCRPFLNLNPISELERRHHTLLVHQLTVHKMIWIQKQSQLPCPSQHKLIGFCTLIDELDLKIKELEMVKKIQTAYFNPKEMTNDELNTFTGFDSETFFKIFNFLNFKERRSPLQEFTPLQEFFVFMIKLRTGVTLDFLAYVFKVSSSTISRTFNKVTEIVYLKISQVDIWPDRQQVLEYMPASFKSKLPRNYRLHRNICAEACKP
ncbi:uncharacterized protein [Parasteatoda tepidariorum]|uniref:uncharacterized protein n=1 Tax=Parasteatoda tepidariorum TaxID=114398 RepID=UPI0039BC3C76